MKTIHFKFNEFKEPHAQKICIYIKSKLCKLYKNSDKKKILKADNQGEKITILTSDKTGFRTWILE